MKTRISFSCLLSILFLNACFYPKNKISQAKTLTDSIEVRDSKGKTIEGNKKLKIIAKWLKKSEADNIISEYSILAQKDNEVLCPQGTKISIKANSLVYAKSGEPVSGKVKLQISEYYKLEDFIKNHLTTTCNDSLLESGGTIFLNATANGEKVALKQGEVVEISFPTDKYKEGMMLFDGSKQNEFINWNLNPLYRDTFYITKPDINAEDTPPTFPIAGKDALDNFLIQNSAYPRGGYQNASEGPVFVRFIVRRNGSISNIELLKTRDPLLDSAAILTVKKLPRFKPAVYNKKFCSYSITVPVRFYLWYNKYHPQYYTQELESRFLLGKEDPDYVASLESDTAKVRRKEYKLLTASFGWINCDRFVNRNLSNQKICTEATSVLIVFKNLKSIMYARKDETGNFVARVPYGEPVNIIALRKENDKIFVAHKSTSTSLEPIKNLKYKESTLAKVEKDATIWN
jgi:TonB family protein